MTAEEIRALTADRDLNVSLLLREIAAQLAENNAIAAKMLDLMERAPLRTATLAVAQMRHAAARAELDKMTLEEIEEVIRKVRTKRADAARDGETAPKANAEDWYRAHPHDPKK